MLTILAVFGVGTVTALAIAVRLCSATTRKQRDEAVAEQTVEAQTEWLRHTQGGRR